MLDAMMRDDVIFLLWSTELRCSCISLPASGQPEVAQITHSIVDLIFVKQKTAKFWSTKHTFTKLSVTRVNSDSDTWCTVQWAEHWPSNIKQTTALCASSLELDNKSRVRVFDVGSSVATRPDRVRGAVHFLRRTIALVTGLQALELATTFR